MTIKEQVKELLEKNASLRDSDLKLIWAYWIVFDKTIEPDKITLKLENYMKSTPQESITRARRAVQEENEHLRGSTWVQEKRKAKEETKGQFINEETNVEIKNSGAGYLPEIEQIRNQSPFRPSSYGKWIKDATVNDIPDKVK